MQYSTLRRMFSNFKRAPEFVHQQTWLVRYPIFRLLALMNKRGECRCGTRTVRRLHTKFTETISQARFHNSILVTRISMAAVRRSEEHTSELQSRLHLVC